MTSRERERELNVGMAEVPESTGQAAENAHKGIKWDSFPVMTAQALRGVLDELDVSTVDRDPTQTSHIRDAVTYGLTELSLKRHVIGGDYKLPKLTNSEIADYFAVATNNALVDRDVELAATLKSISIMAKVFERVRTSKAK